MTLDISSKNYLSWILDTKMYLNAIGPRDTIKENNNTSNHDRTKTLIFICHHWDEKLKIKYFTVKDLLVL